MNESLLIFMQIVVTGILAGGLFAIVWGLAYTYGKNKGFHEGIQYTNECYVDYAIKYKKSSKKLRNGGVITVTYQENGKEGK